MEPSAADVWGQTRQRAPLTSLMVSKLSNFPRHAPPLRIGLHTLPAPTNLLSRFRKRLRERGDERGRFPPSSMPAMEKSNHTEGNKKIISSSIQICAFKTPPRPPQKKSTCLAFASHGSTRIISFHKHAETRQRNRLLSGFISCPRFPTIFFCDLPILRS